MHGRGCVEGRISLVIFNIGKPCMWAPLPLVSCCVLRSNHRSFTVRELLHEHITGLKWRTINWIKTMVVCKRTLTFCFFLSTGKEEWGSDPQYSRTSEKGRMGLLCSPVSPQHPRSTKRQREGEWLQRNPHVREVYAGVSSPAPLSWGWASWPKCHGFSLEVSGESSRWDIQGIQ